MWTCTQRIILCEISDFPRIFADRRTINKTLQEEHSRVDLRGVSGGFKGESQAVWGGFKGGVGDRGS